MACGHHSTPSAAYRTRTVASRRCEARGQVDCIQFTVRRSVMVCGRSCGTRQDTPSEARSAYAFAFPNQNASESSGLHRLQMFGIDCQACLVIIDRHDRVDAARRAPPHRSTQKRSNARAPNASKPQQTSQQTRQRRFCRPVWRRLFRLARLECRFGFDLHARMQFGIKPHEA